jgi:hypothetical protein
MIMLAFAQGLDTINCDTSANSGIALRSILPVMMMLVMLMLVNKRFDGVIIAVISTDISPARRNAR